MDAVCARIPLGELQGVDTEIRGGDVGSSQRSRYGRQPRTTSNFQYPQRRARKTARERRCAALGTIVVVVVVGVAFIVLVVLIATTTITTTTTTTITTTTTNAVVQQERHQVSQEEPGGPDVGPQIVLVGMGFHVELEFLGFLHAMDPYPLP